MIPIDLTSRRTDMKRTLFSAVVVLTTSGAIADVTTTWDSGTFEGWTQTPTTDGGEWELLTAGGNPDGYVRYNDGPIGGAMVTRLYAPVPYLGDYSSYGPGAGFRYDALWEGTINPAINMPVIRLLGSSGEIAEGFAAGDNDGTWQTVFLSLEESSWNMINGDWNTLLANVTGLELIGDNGVGAGPEAGVDNFTLVVPASSSVALLSLGGLVSMRRRR
jgi:hypothetical protein